MEFAGASRITTMNASEGASSETGKIPSTCWEVSKRADRIGRAVSLTIRLLSATYRWRLHDPENLSGDPPDSSCIWAFWHNRIFVVPVLYRKYLKTRRGAVLSSASRDGEIIAATVSRFGCYSVRGSSSRRGTAAFLGLAEWLKQGFDVAVVPDGPRGPRYRLGPGVVKLAQKTGARILPIRVEYGSAWRFKSWDQFMLPKPFTTVDIFFDPLIQVPSDLPDDHFEQERLRIEELMNPRGET